ncbi:TlyA family RNA methyltransferase [Paeniglutamicibacter sp. ABSL32-1]|uniref:TlyA family RNA methyltransferase n=1 Tax=Paeniglutamicibacter quisquiliarum TaxID=2849498 RepID=UPI001C2D3A93|nr:TlyA family RNA methyltransferase [Paeniglutamicibacter quisquiliarum]MBV1780485.1 TlyA family RNA methyltransferase [Paeniglutamicibacter quisquiliarum]
MSRLDQELVTRSLARSRTDAARLIADQRVRVDGMIATKAAKNVAETSAITVQAAAGEEFVSRAGHKLAGALAAFSLIEVAGKRCLDAGASTGGFTDVLLRRGADHVEAVDVGHGQLVPELRADARVHVHEGMNVRYLDPADIGGEVALVVADLSFISLTLVMGALAGATEQDGDLVLMVKPQFEIGREQLSRTGVVHSPDQRRKAVDVVMASAHDAGLGVKGLARSPLPGQDGNVEFFLWLGKDTGHNPEASPQPRVGTDAWPDVDYS